MTANNFIFRNSFFLLAVFLILLSADRAAEAQGSFSIAPMIESLTIPAGGEKTLAITVNYSGEETTAKLPNVRMGARLEDWTVDGDGQIQLRPPGSTDKSAVQWITASQSEFVMVANRTQVLRFTVSVPAGTKPGDYLFGVFTEDRTPPPPFEAGKKQVSLRFRYHSIISVKVPGLTREPSLENLEAVVTDGMPVVLPTLTNKGNSQAAAVHAYEIRDESDRIVAEMKDEVSRPLLGGHTMKLRFPVRKALPVGKYKVVYKVDFRAALPIIVGRTSFEISEADFLAANKSIVTQPSVVKTVEEPKKPANSGEKPAAAGKTEIKADAAKTDKILTNKTTEISAAKLP